MNPSPENKCAKCERLALPASPLCALHWTQDYWKVYISHFFIEIAEIRNRNHAEP